MTTRRCKVIFNPVQTSFDFDRPAPQYVEALCPWCDEGMDSGALHHWCLDVQTDHENGDRYIVWRPCCESMDQEVRWLSYEEVMGRSMVTTIEEILGMDGSVLKITEPGDGAIVCRLQAQSPVQVKTDKDGELKDPLARGGLESPKGWQSELFADVRRHHRHHKAPQGWKFGIAVYNGGVKVGCAVVGRPGSRVLQKKEPKTWEVTRVCTWGHSALRQNVVSKLYAACAKQARAFGVTKLVTYTLAKEESGVSLKASGWVPDRLSAGGSHDRPSRPRQDKAPTGEKIRWAKGLNKKTAKAIRALAMEISV